MKDIKLLIIIVGFLSSSCVGEMEPSKNCDTISLDKYKNGQIKQLRYYKNCELDGYLINYYESGMIESKLFFRQGKQDDTTFSYYEQGQMRSWAIFENGIINGLFLSFYENGDTMDFGEYTLGFKSGIWVHYDSLSQKHFIVQGDTNYKSEPDNIKNILFEAIVNGGETTVYYDSSEVNAK